MDNNYTTDRIEKLAARLGAEAAIRKVSAPPAMKDIPAPPTRIRWKPGIAIAATLAIGIGIGLVVAPSGDKKVVGSKNMTDEITRLKGENQRLIGQIDDLKRTHSDEITDLRDSHDTRVKSITSTHSLAQKELERDYEDQISKLKKVNDEANLKIKKYQNEIAQLREKKPGESPNLAKKLDELKERITLLEKEQQDRDKTISNLTLKATILTRKIVDEQQRSAKLSDKLEVANRWIAYERSHSASLYIEASAPSLTGLRAIQVTARRNRLIARCYVMRSRNTGPRIRNILDRIEVSLIRLEMLNPEDPASISIVRKISESRLVEMITEISSTIKDNPSLDRFLMEAGIIMEGIKGV